MGIPRSGLSTDQLRSAFDEMRSEDADWRSARTWSLVYSAGDEHDAMLHWAYDTFFHENGLSPTAFPSLGKMESEVVRALLGHLGADPATAGGTMSSGGTESITLAMKAYRDRAAISTPNMVIPSTAHPAFTKAALLLGIECRRVEVDEELTADVGAMADRVDDETIVIGASAPAYPYGLVDPIAELGRVAAERGVGLHVDASLGGIALPFIRELGRPVPDFDFTVPGVSSVSVDLHKYGFAAKGASAVLYRDRPLRRHQFTVMTDWPGGALSSPTLLGTRPGGSIAAAWAAIHHLGADGYLRLFSVIMETVDRLVSGLADIGDLEVIGDPPTGVLAVTSGEKDLYAIADGLERRGWRIDRQANPDSLHHIVTPRHSEVIDAYLDDMEAEYRTAPSPPESGHRVGFYGVTSGVVSGGDLEAALLDDLESRYDLTGSPGSEAVTG